MNIYCPYCMSLVNTGQMCLKCGREPESYSPSSHHFPPGKLLKGRYLVGRSLGEGGFGITYLGLDTTLERRVAIKEYFPTVFVYRESWLSLDVTCYTGSNQPFYQKGRDQFIQEARVMARLDTTAEIVQVLDFFLENNTGYIVMEYLEGTNLRTILNNQNRIPTKKLLQMMEPLLRAMNTMHSAGIIHRDISPDNMMLLTSGQIKLLDFGCARDIDTEHSMTVMLKHGYAPIEQYTGYNQGPWTDVYAICATIYRCLTGKMPPRALERINEQDLLIAPNKLGATLTLDQEQALLRGLAVEPRDRWQSIASLYAALYGTVIKNPEEQKTEILGADDTDNPLKESTEIPPKQTIGQGEKKKQKKKEPQPQDKKRIKWWMVIVALFVLAMIGSISEELSQITVGGTQAGHPSAPSPNVSAQSTQNSSNAGNNSREALIADLFVFLTVTEKDAADLVSEARSEIASIMPEDLENYGTDDRSHAYVDTKVSNTVEICRQLHELSYISDEELGDMFANIIGFLYNLVKINKPSVVFIYDPKLLEEGANLGGERAIVLWEAVKPLA